MLYFSGLFCRSKYIIHRPLRQRRQLYDSRGAQSGGIAARHEMRLFKKYNQPVQYPFCYFSPRFLTEQNMTAELFRDVQGSGSCIFRKVSRTSKRMFLTVQIHTSPLLLRRAAQQKNMQMKTTWNSDLRFNTVIWISTYSWGHREEPVREPGTCGTESAHSGIRKQFLGISS